MPLASVRIFVLASKILTIILSQKKKMGKENYICFYDKDRRRPCPKCGSRWVAYESTRYDRKGNGLDAYIICRDCGWKTHPHKTVEEAIKDWNG